MDRIYRYSEELVNGLCDILSGNVESIIIYGSVAKGTDTPESDVDVALILRNVLDSAHEQLLSEFVTDLNLKYDTVFSVIDIEKDEFEKWGDISPFYSNVKEEGVVLWKAA